MVSRLRFTASSASVDTSPQPAPRSRAQCAQRRVVALCVGAGHPAQRLRQRRKLVDRRQRAEHHVLRAGAVAQQIGDALARLYRARANGTWSTTSLTPVTTTARSITGSSASRSSSSACAVVKPDRASKLHCDARRAGLRPAAAATGRLSAACCVATPTPAADESPAISRRKRAAPRPAHAFACAGSFGQPRHAMRACAAPAPPAAGSTRASARATSHGT